MTRHYGVASPVMFFKTKHVKHVGQLAKKRAERPYPMTEATRYAITHHTVGEFDLLVVVHFVDEDGDWIDTAYECDSDEDARRWVAERGGVLTDDETGHPQLETLDRLIRNADGILPDRDIDGLIVDLFGDEHARSALKAHMAAEYYSSNLVHTLGLVTRLLPGWKIAMEAAAEVAYTGRSDGSVAKVTLQNGRETVAKSKVNLSLAILDCICHLAQKGIVKCS